MNKKPNINSNTFDINIIKAIETPIESIKTDASDSLLDQDLYKELGLNDTDYEEQMEYAEQRLQYYLRPNPPGFNSPEFL